MYAIELTPEFTKQAGALHPRRYKQLHMRVFALQANPRPPDCVLIDVATYRVHIGLYTITYEIDDSEHRVRVFLLEETD